MDDLRLDPSWTRVHPGAFVARGAVVLGDVTIGDAASVWFGAVLRGDVEHLEVGAESNVQDGAVLHADPGCPTILGPRVTVGHGCIVHGAVVGEACLLGMGAILLDGAVVGERCLVGAGALIPGGRTIPPRSLVLGSPAKVVRELTRTELDALDASAVRYVEKARAFRAAGHGDPAFHR